MSRVNICMLLSVACWLVALGGLVYNGGFLTEVTWVPFLLTPVFWLLTLMLVVGSER